jgi:flagellar basal-body rod protein FlgB
MEFLKQPLFAMISQRLGWLTERQKVLAENVANADTPDYKARDVKEPSFQQMLRGSTNSLPAARTSSNHLTSGSGQRGFGPNDMTREKAYETTLSGNAVTLDVELMKVAQTAQDHQMATQLYRKHLNLFRTVIGRGGAG